MTLAIVMLTWRRPSQMLNQSLWTLGHQTRSPSQIVVVEASPEDVYHRDTAGLCHTYAGVKLVEARWSRFNVSRGINCGLRTAREDADYVAAVGMELLFSANFVEVLETKLGPDRYVRAACGNLWITVESPEAARADWAGVCNQVRPYPPRVCEGAVLCAPRWWWHEVRGYDEARRPYSYPDVDVYDRAIRSGLDTTHNIEWGAAQVVHPYHEFSPLFYSISGYPVDAAGVDKDVVRNPRDWGEVGGDEPVRIPGT